MTHRRLIWIVLLALAIGAAGAEPAGAIFADHFDSGAEIGPEKVPCTGSPSILVLRANILTEDDPDWGRWETYFHDEVWANSFETYWDVNSLGAYTPETALLPMVDIPECPIPGADPCTFGMDDLGSVIAAINFLKDFLGTAIPDLAIDMQDYDLLGPDGVPDGWADGVLLLVNAPFRSISFPIFVFDETDFNGVRIGAVGVMNASRDVDVALHEFGHLLGWADMYDEDSSSAGLTYTLMGGSRNFDGTGRTSLINAYDRLRIGWAGVVDITGNRRVTLEPAATTGSVYRVGVSDTEYFLLENRQPLTMGGFALDAGGLINSAGLAVWHVDDSVKPDVTGVIGLPNLNRDDWHPRVMLEQADGRYDLQNDIPTIEDDDLFMEGDIFAPSPAHEPIGPDNQVMDSNYYSGTPSNLSLSGIDTVSRAPDIVADISYDDTPPLFACAAADPGGGANRSPSPIHLLLCALALAVFWRRTRT